MWNTAFAFGAPPTPMLSLPASTCSSAVLVSPSTIKSTSAPASLTRIELVAVPSIARIPVLLAITLSVPLC